MGKITITAYDKVLYMKTLPDKVCYAIAKEREKQDREFEKKTREGKEEKTKEQ